MSILEQRFYTLVNEHGMLDTDSVLLGFSGGADSSVLLHLLIKAKENFNFELKCVHINHMIRGAEAMRDESFCIDVCDKLGIELFVVRENIPKYAQSLGVGLEEAARDFRYKTFEKLCLQHSISTIATAHNATDNAETLIFNLCRGAGSKGACGILPVRDNIIRPLLLSSKEQIIEYALENSIEFVTDSTNADTVYTRNFIRSDIIPSLERVNCSAIDSISKFTRIMKEESDYLEKCATPFLEENRISVLSTLDNVILSRVIKQKFQNEYHKDLDFQNVSDIISLIRKPTSYSSISLSNEVDAIAQGDIFSFGKRIAINQSKDYKVYLHFGENVIEEADALIYISDPSDPPSEDYINKKQNIYKLFITKTLVFDKIIGSMYARPRQESDKYLINNMHKSVKKYMCDEKFPRDRRFTTPFLCDDNGIFWIPGMRERDGLMPFENDNKNLINVYFFQNKKDV